MKATIEQRFNENLARVENLVKIYQDHLAGSGPGRRSHHKTDVLRAAVVLLHASMEDLLRSLARWKLPEATPAVLSKIPLLSAAPALKFDLGALAAHRGEPVTALIEASVAGYLDRSNYNNTTELATLLESIGVGVAQVNAQFDELSILMNRRHLVVHRADRDDQGGQGHHSVRSIGRTQVQDWVNAVREFGKNVLNQVPA